MQSYRKRPRKKLPPPLAGGGEQSDAQQPIARGRGHTPTQLSRELRAQASDAEHKLWHYLRRKTVHGHRFRRQFPLGPYFADFCCLPVRLVVEVDGDQHAEPAQALHDARRTAWLNENNFCVIRFAASDVITSIDGVLQAIDLVVSEQEQMIAHLPLPLREGANSERASARNLGEGYSRNRPLPRVASLRAPSREGRGE